MAELPHWTNATGLFHLWPFVTVISSLSVMKGIRRKIGPPDTRVIDVHGRTVVPGLNDSHVYVVRAGLNYNMERDGVPTLAEGSPEVVRPGQADASERVGSRCRRLV